MIIRNQIPILFLLLSLFPIQSYATPVDIIDECGTKYSSEYLQEKYPNEDVEQKAKINRTFFRDELIPIYSKEDFQSICNYVTNKEECYNCYEKQKFNDFFNNGLVQLSILITFIIIIFVIISIIRKRISKIKK